MEFEFDCVCGNPVSDFTRGDPSEVDLIVECSDCGAIYALTVTQIRTGVTNAESS